MRGELDLFFNPKTIAVIGASNNPAKVGNILIRKLKKFKGNIVPVNLKEEMIENFPSYRKLKDYKHKIDLVVIATPRKTFKKILKDIKKKQIKNVIIITAGFGETGNKKEEDKIIKWGKENDINILGPNCFGFVNSKLNLDLTFSKSATKDGDTVFLSQSGALGSFIMDTDIKLRAFISLGNMIDLDFSDFIEYFNHDKKTKKIVLYIEKLKEGKRFIEVCRNSKKEIIVVKSGKTEKGKKATMSHTGSIGSDFDIYKGAFKQAKVKYSKSLSAAFGLKKENIKSKLTGKNIAIITNAGGAGVLLDDELIAEKFKVAGPKDILGTATPNDYRRALHRISKPYDNIVVIFTPQTMSNPDGVAKAIIESRWKKKIIAIFLGEKSIKKALKILKENKVTTFTRAI